jgi:PhnB protein
MKINAYLNFNGECEEAFNFYAQVLDGKVSYMSSWEG